MTVGRAHAPKNGSPVALVSWASHPPAPVSRPSRVIGPKRAGPCQLGQRSTLQLAPVRLVGGLDPAESVVGQHEARVIRPLVSPFDGLSSVEGERPVVLSSTITLHQTYAQSRVARESVVRAHPEAQRRRADVDHGLSGDGSAGARGWIARSTLMLSTISASREGAACGQSSSPGADRC